MAFNPKQAVRDFFSKEMSAQRAESMKSLREELQSEQDASRRIEKETQLRRARLAQATAATGRVTASAGKLAGKGLMTTLAVGGSVAGAAASGARAGARALSGLDAFFIFTLLVHGYDAIFNFQDTRTRLFLYTIITLWAGFGVFKSEIGKFNLGDLIRPAGISGLQLAAPIIASLPLLSNIFIIKTILAFAPFWPIYIMINYSMTRVIKLAVFLYVVLWAVIGWQNLAEASTVIDRVLPVKINVADSISKVGESFKKGINGIITTVKNIPSQIIKSKDRFLLQYAGDYYTGNVDRNVKEPLGVYIERVKSADPKYYFGDTVVIYGVLRARTLDSSIPIDIKTSCYEGDDNSPDRIGTVARNKFTVESFDVFDLECNMKELKEGSHVIKLAAEFENFPTYGYVKAYFMDRQRLRELLRENIDPLDRFGITEKKPQAVYTNGPIMLGMGTSSEIVGISKGIETITPRLGITLDNNWLGKVIEIKELYLQVPKQMSITEGKEACGPNYNVKSVDNKEFSEEVAKDDNYKTYKLERVPGRTLEAKTPTTILCNLNVDNSDEFLGATPVAIKYFRAKINYKYKITQQLSVTVNRLPSGYISRKALPIAVDSTKDIGEITPERLRKIIDSSSAILPNLKEPCKKHAENIVQSSKDSGTDPLFTLSTIVQESGCNENAYSIEPSGDEKFGLMKVSKKGVISDCKSGWESNPVLNTDCGLKIFWKEYDKFTGSCDVISCKNHPYPDSCPGFKCDVKCNKDYLCEYAYAPAPVLIYYTSEKAGLRAYNGWANTNTNYADEIWDRYNALISTAKLVP